MTLFERMDAMANEGYSREEVVVKFEKEIDAYVRAEYIRQCYLNSLSDEEYDAVVNGTTTVTKWLETK